MAGIQRRGRPVRTTEGFPEEFVGVESVPEVTLARNGLGFDAVRPTALAIDPAKPRQVFVGTSAHYAEGGLYLSKDAGLTWKRISGVPVPISSIAVGADSVAIVGTGESGVFTVR